MSQQPFFDVHTHAFHSKIAMKVLNQLQNHYHIPAVGTGEIDDLQGRLKRAGIEYNYVHCAATCPEQVIPANRWAASLLKYKGVVPFGTLHPAYDKFEDELSFLFDKGIRGIKLHPDFQGFRLDDPALLPIFGALEGTFTLMVHVGDRLPPAENASCPYKVAALKRRFPKLQIIAAHFGGVWHWKYVVDALKGMDVYFDTSSSLFAIPDNLLKEIFNSFPRRCFLFGSDYPLFDPLEEMQRLQYRLRLTDGELAEIMSAAAALHIHER